MSKKLFVLFSVMFLLACPVFAQSAPAAAAAQPVNWVAIAAGFSIAIAAGLAGLGQGKIGAAACEGVARNPAASAGIQTAMLLGLAFVESLVLFTFVMILLKVK
jgi:F-type H+-transporting ATPase subunit c